MLSESGCISLWVVFFQALKLSTQWILFKYIVNIVFCSILPDGPVDYRHLPESLCYIKRRQGALKWKTDSHATHKLIKLCSNRNFWKKLRYHMPSVPSERCQIIDWTERKTWILPWSLQIGANILTFWLFQTDEYGRFLETHDSSIWTPGPWIILQDVSTNKTWLFTTSIMNLTVNDSWSSSLPKNTVGSYIMWIMWNTFPHSHGAEELV